MGAASAKNALSKSRDTVDLKYIEAMDRLDRYRPKPPEGSFTVLDAAEQWGVAKNTASKKLTAMYKGGELERMATKNNKMYYWFTDQKGVSDGEGPIDV